MLAFDKYFLFIETSLSNERSFLFSKYYSPGPANLLFGKQPIGVKGLPFIFDSGSSYTYFASQDYKAFIDAVSETRENMILILL